MTTASPGVHGVIRAIRDLHGRHSQWPTAEEIAAYLEYPLLDVRRELRNLQERRLFRRRRRQNRSVWMPWEEP